MGHRQMEYSNNMLCTYEGCFCLCICLRVCACVNEGELETEKRKEERKIKEGTRKMGREINYLDEKEGVYRTERLALNH